MSGKTSRKGYVQEILRLYRSTPGTRGRVREADRCLAEDLHRRGIPIHQVRAALLLAAARRTFRDTDLGPLEPIGSLHYFLPVLEELERQPLDPGYIQHIHARLIEATNRHTTAHRSP